MPRHPMTDAERIERNQARHESRFGDAVQRLHRQSRNVSAWAIIDPAKPGTHWGKVVATYPRDRGSVYVVAWMPHGADRPDLWRFTHAHRATGHGYDRTTAAMGGARFTAPDGTERAIIGEGTRWDDQLRDAGFLVIQTV